MAPFGPDGQQKRGETMTAAREALEAVIWRVVTRPDEATQAQRVRAVLAAADDYAEYVGGITAERRAVLAPPPPPLAVHWQLPGREAGAASCHGRLTRSPVTSEWGKVTCGNCTQSRAWREAARM
jgi:hypothetical protein